MELSPFQERMLTVLVPQFCDDPTRGWGRAGFTPDWNLVGTLDAEDFLYALDANLVEHVGRGQYNASLSNAKEQFFWSGSKASYPRKFTIWAEPVITVAVVGRLHRDYGWPTEFIGMQSKNGAFDFLTKTLGLPSRNYIAGEVKKTAQELKQMVEQMQYYGKRPYEVAPEKHKNAYRKVLGLREWKAPIFWAVGPDRLSMVFQMSYSADGSMQFEQVSEEEIAYPRQSIAVT